MLLALITQFIFHFQVPEDLIYVAEIQKKFNDLQIIPGFLLPRPSSSSPSPIHSTTLPFQVTVPIIIHNPFPIEAFNDSIISTLPDDQYYETSQPPVNATTPLTSHMEDVSEYFNKPLMHTFLSMNSLEKLLMKLPSVAPPPSSKSLPSLLRFPDESLPWFSPSQYPLMGIDQEEAKDHQMIQIHHKQRACP